MVNKVCDLTKAGINKDSADLREEFVINVLFKILITIGWKYLLFYSNNWMFSK